MEVKQLVPRRPGNINQKTNQVYKVAKIPPIITDEISRHTITQTELPRR